MILRRFLGSGPGVTGLGIVAALLAAAVLAPLFTDADPLGTSLAAFAAPGRGVPFGTDNLGRDVFAGVLYGARVSLAVGILAAAVSALVGIAIGMTAGYTGGRTDTALMRAAELCQTIPQFFLALLVVALIGRGLEKVILVLGLLGWPLTARLIRAEFLSLKEREFVESARALGMAGPRIALRVILPNALPPAVVAATFGVAEAILLEAGLSFFGLGDPNLGSWGVMLQNAQGYLRRAWWMAVFPGLGITLAVFGFNLLGDGLTDALNPRLRELSR